jgi:regulatory protein
MPLGPPNRSASARRSFRRASGRAQADHPESAEAARRAALVLLARRDYARTELSHKLQAKGFIEPAIAEALAALEAERLLDDRRFLDAFVRSHAQRGQGPGRIRRELQALGLAAEAIEQALSEAPDFVTLCREVRERKFGRKLPASWPEKSRQARFLQYRGFSADHIRLALGQNPEWADSETDLNE